MAAPRAALLLASLLVLGTLAAAQSDENVLVCGGFVKPFKTIRADALDLSAVKVLLYTPDGLLKHQSTCAPTGYYFVPVYDQGDYTLKVDAPEGWAFESVERKVTATPKHTCESDIDFVITGFRVSGKVSVASACGAPKVDLSTVAVTLVDASGASTTTKVAPTGAFAFDNVQPGAATLQASHPTWTLSTTSQQINVLWQNLVLTESFQVTAFDVSGSIDFQGTALEGVQIFLTGASSATVGCTFADAAVSKVNDALCSAVTDANGAFSFRSVGCGAYHVVPVYKAGFEIEPASASVNVQATGKPLSVKFSALGFSVSGQVTQGAGGVVAGAAVVLAAGSKELTATTDASGKYTFTRVVPGSYSLRATKAGMTISSQSAVTIGVTTSELPDLVVEKYDVCGQVAVAGVPSHVSTQRQRSVRISQSGTTVTTATTDDAGNFCVALAPGSYHVEAVSNAAERSKGLVFSPESQAVTVDHAHGAVSGLSFSPARSSVSGSVKCIQSCGSALKVTLAAVGSTDSQSTAVGADGRFVFASVWPGSYALTVRHAQDGFCFGNGASVETAPSMPVQVSNTDVAGVEFVQSGYRAVVRAPHRMELTLSSGTNTVTTQAGVSDTAVCLPAAGVYRFKAAECIHLSKGLQFDTSAPAAVDVTVDAYTVTGTLETGSGISGLSAEHLSVAADVDGKAVKTTITPSASGFSYSFQAAPGSSVTVKASNSASPRTNALLFNPTSLNTKIGRQGCPTPLNPIKLREGLYLAGNISPALSDVTVKVYVEGAEHETATTQSGQDGKYRVGPLDPDAKYVLEASKPGFHFETVTGSTTDFVHKKLGQLEIDITDQAGEPVSGVLLSLSRDRFRSNNQTRNGKFVFESLFPGSYSVHPILKEYTFSPSSAAVEIQEGSASKFSFAAKRVAFSCYGFVRSLNGEPEARVTVQAIAEGAPHEETMTGPDGSYRIRGLVPGKKYTVSVRDVSGQVAPASVPVTVTTGDVRDVAFFVLPQQGGMTVSGVVDIPDKHAHTVSVQLSVNGRVMQTAKLSLARYYEFHDVQPGNYVVTPVTSLSTTDFEVVAPAQNINVNQKERPFARLSVSVTPRNPAETVGTGSFWVLALALLLGWAAINREVVLPKLKALRDGKAFSTPASAPATPTDVHSSFLPELPKSSKARRVK